ncbi:hypothetical protein Goshw_018170 [Gossypium schwendimanii]|uniref:DUF4283 domain-containing protein n=1 Tax=Gossypium schwendimanii TaxID=34291 RepID=A0A7J9NFP9_GOSSC|nr:hypothetical protein [Gossypium schwendimanii]
MVNVGNKIGATEVVMVNDDLEIMEDGIRVSLEGLYPEFFFSATSSKIVVWMRMSGLPYRYYNKKLLRLITGTLRKVDYNTTKGKKGKFVWFAIVVDLKKPLKAFVGINDIPFCIEYEGLPSICYKCDYYKHLHEHCPSKRKELEETRPAGNESRPFSLSINKKMAGQNCFGLWMQAPGQKRRPDFENVNFVSGKGCGNGKKWEKGIEKQRRKEKTWAGRPSGNVKVETSGPSGVLAVGLEQNGPKVIERPMSLSIMNHRAILIKDDSSSRTSNANTECDVPTEVISMGEVPDGRKLSNHRIDAENNMKEASVAGDSL